MDSDSDTTMYVTEEESLSDSEKQYFYKIDDCIIYKEDLKKLINSNDNGKKAKLNALVTTIIKKHECRAFKTLVKHGYKVEPMDETGQTVLHLAFHSYYSLTEDRGKMFFKCASEKNYVDKFGLSHFHIACHLGNLPVVEKYLENKVDINIHCHNGNAYEKSGTPLHFAILSHRLKVVQLLIENGADINARDSIGRTCLHLAAITYEYPEVSCWEDDLNIMKIFAANSDFINSKDCNNRTPIQEVFSGTFHVQEITLYTKLNDDGTTMRPTKYLNVFPKIRQMEKIKMLLELGADVTILHNAVLYDILEDMETLRCAGNLGRLGDPGAVSFDDSLHVDTMKQILSAGQNIDVNEKNSNADSLLQLALCSISFDMVKLLLDHGADIRNLKIAGRTKSSINYPMIFPTFECVNNVFAIIELMANKGSSLSDEDNLIFLRLFLHDVPEKGCECDKAVQLTDEHICCSDVLSYSMPNHLDWLQNVSYTDILGDLDIYWKDVKYADLYIAKEIEVAVTQVLENFHPSQLITNFVPNIKEIDYMKTISLRKNVSLYDILKMHPHTIYPYIADNDFTFLQNFCQYKNFIKGHITKSLIRHYFEESAYKYLEIFLTSLEYPCLRKIISYLNNKDIWAVSQAAVLGNSDQ